MAVHEFMSGLRVANPEFYFQVDEPLWISNIQFGKNVGKKLALVDGKGSRGHVHGIVRLGKPIEVESIENLTDRITTPIFFKFKDFEDTLFAYPVHKIEHFFTGRKILDGLENHSSKWIKELMFERRTPTDFENLSQNQIQSEHDRIHAILEKSEFSESLFHTHYFLVEQFDRCDMNHPCLDQLDWQYEFFRLKTLSDRPEKFNDLLSWVEENINEKLSEIKSISESLALSLLESDDLPDLLRHIGRWTIEDVKQWFATPISNSQATKVANAANARFVQLLSQGRSVIDAMQLAVSFGAAQLDENAVVA